MNETDKLSNSGWTPLMLSILQDCPELTETLLDKGADPNLTTQSADNPCRSSLAVAISNGRLTAVKLLVSHSADINALNCQGMTSLGLAEKLARRPFRQEAMAEIVSFLKQAQR